MSMKKFDPIHELPKTSEEYIQYAMEWFTTDHLPENVIEEYFKEFKRIVLEEKLQEDTERFIYYEPYQFPKTFSYSTFTSLTGTKR